MIFILPVSLVYIIGSYYCKVLKDEEGGALPLWLFLEEGNTFVNNETGHFYVVFR